MSAVLVDYLDEALDLLKTELKLLKLGLHYPAEFQAKQKIRQRSDRQIYLSPEVSQVDLMEVISGFHYKKCALDIQGKPVPLNWLVEGFGILFNMKIGDMYKREEAIFNRDQSIRTAFLDALVGVIRKTGQYRGDL